MAVGKVKIEIPDYNDFTMSTNINRNPMVVRMTWNSTAKRWMFGAYKTDMTPIVTGVVVVPNHLITLFTGREELEKQGFVVQSKEKEIRRNSFKEGKAVLWCIYVK